MTNFYNTDNDKVVGFKKEAETIIDQLIRGPKEKDVVLITGMGGLGKTTLARRVYDEENVVNYFDNRAWCTVYQEYDFKGLLQKIYSQVCGCETGIDDVAEKLRKSLMGKRYLIVLDDIWSVEAWEELNRVFPSCDDIGSRIVLTSRQNNVVPEAKRICLPFFTTDESWELLEVKLFKGERCPKVLENIGREISKKCGGLPLVVGLVAGLLEGIEKTEEMWHEFLTTLNSHSALRGGVQTNDAIELSYKHLSHHLKPCLLYFAAFPEDKVIEVSYLKHLWIAEGFVDIIEDKVEDYLNCLVDSNLIMVSERKYDGHILSCVVHDLVRDFCLTKAENENFLQVDILKTKCVPRSSSIRTHLGSKISCWDAGHVFKDSWIAKKFKHITIMFKKKLDPTLSATPRRISFHVYEIKDDDIPYELVPWSSSIHTVLVSKNTFRWGNGPVYNGSWIDKKFEHLTILDLEFIKVHKSIFSEINTLIHLRYLALSLASGIIRCCISPLSLRRLERLITLRLSSGGNLHFPKIFWGMRSLRHMIINHHCDLCEMDSTPDIEAIPISEVMQILNVDCCLSTRDGDLLRKLPHLKDLSCSVSESYPFPEIDFLHHLECLKLFAPCKHDRHLLNDLKLSKFPATIKEINLYGITVSLSAISIIAQLLILESLMLRYCKFEEGLKWNVEEETQFHKLKYLQLEGLDIRKWNISSANESFPCLEQLLLEGCQYLEGMPSSLGDITTLKLIRTSFCKFQVNSSVKEIEEDARDLGNAQLKIEIKNAFAQ